MSGKKYGNKEVIGDSACPSCTARGHDRTGNHLQHWINHDTEEQWVWCPKCNHYEKIDDGNKSHYDTVKRIRKEWTPEELKAVLEEIQDCPIKELTSRAIKKATAERFGIRAGLSGEDGTTVISHFYPKTRSGETVAYKVRNLEHKAFYSKGDGTDTDLFGIEQARQGDVYTGKLFIFEDELSCASGFQVLVENSKSAYKPACVSLPNGASAATTAISRNREFVDSFQEVVVCMDNDEAGEEAVKRIRALIPNIKVAKIPKGKTKEGKLIKDANDLLMEGRGLELNNILRFNAAKESPAGHATVSECLDEALKKPEWGFEWPWKGLTDLTYGLRIGEVVAIGGGVGGGKTLIGHELTSHLIMKYGMNVGTFMLEETVGSTLKNVAGKSANVPFHRPDIEYDQSLLTNEIMKYDGKLFLYKNFGQNDWEDIKRVMRFWVVEHDVKFVMLDNVTALVSHLSATEINTEVARIAVELAGMCNELGFTCFVFSHLNPPKTGAPHEEGGQVQEVQFTGSRALMRFSQLIMGFERNKQAEGDAKNYSQIRLLKDRNFGRSGIVPTKYDPLTGRLTERADHEYDPHNPFSVVGEDGIDDGYQPKVGDNERVY
ncbi:putative primase/helicase [Aeromonas phage LAh_8]|uniref:Putative primase/helicase n=1 Tax=Aeromonas phage LAh_8 TaxID=2591032 RepID=A0A514A0D7_9CAUD|nr:DNA primase/helicase [Aeromonas phage LAh_8]QDH46721.1 putative primase/helicase [Aeromonas phage LAh_8]